MRNNPDSYSGSVVIVCHDTGAANALSVVARYLNETYTRPKVICIGAAAGVFIKAGIRPDKEFETEPSDIELEKLFDALKPSAILLGTSLESKAERWFCMKAREQGVYCLAFVDWWSNFGRRFSSPGTVDLQYLPDVVAVMDQGAMLGCMDEGIPAELLHITGNPYWDFLVDIPESVRSDIRACVRAQFRIQDSELLCLIVSSNLRNLNLNLGYDENDFFKSILPLPEQTHKGTPIKWAIKPHPKEARSEFIKMLDDYRLDMTVIEGVSGLEASAASDFILGMLSSVLFEAALQRKKIVSLQPGLDKPNLEFIKIFDCLGIPVITNSLKAKDIVNDLINDAVPFPDISRLPFSIGNEHACKALSNLLLKKI